MKFFAPRNNWDMKSPDSWWPFMGSVPTVSGKRVSEETALSFSAVFAATRVISETLASLPLKTLRRVDQRTVENAITHPLWWLLHDAPNSEQDITTFLDMQTAFQVNWGNAYAEIQRDRRGEIVSLWPIHPSRIPTGNIRRNGSSVEEATLGDPGILVYWVRNDDGTHTPIPAPDMLHVPGVLSKNGITGQSIVRWAANSIGIAMATEEHAGSFFKNGAVANMAIKSAKVLNKDAAGRLREQWQRTFGSPGNHYKTLILEDGMEPVMLTQNPEVTQLLGARQFSVTEIARWYRLPPHLLADLSRSTFSNIEAENLSFVVHSMIPWIVRWEKALQRQLLRPEERGKITFKFNVNSLLRGDSAARAQFYTAMFQMGAASPNDVREREDLNPIPGGDQYFVPGNNLIPLSKAVELAQAQIDQMKPPPMPDEPSDPDPEPTDVPMEPGSDVQATALNGAQIESFVGICERLAMGQFPPVGTKAILEAAFPVMDRNLIDLIVNDMDKFEPEPPPEPPAPEEPNGPAPAGEQPPVPPPATEDCRTQRQLAALRRRIESLLTRQEAVEQVAAALNESSHVVAGTLQNLEPLAQSMPLLEEKVDGLPDKLAEAVDATVQTLVKHVEAQEATRTEVFAAQDAAAAERQAEIEAHVREAIEATKAAAESLGAIPQQVKTVVSDELKPVSEQIQAIPEQTTARLADSGQKQSAADTAQAEALAVREAQLAARQLALNERLQAERVAAHRAITRSLKACIANLSVWERKSIAKAVEKPREWKEWRSKFYPRFLKQFEADLGEFVADSEACGVKLDLRRAADQYARESISDLQTLDVFAADNYYDRVKEGADFLVKTQWSERPGKLAAEMVEAGKQRFAAQESSNATPDD